MNTDINNGAQEPDPPLDELSLWSEDEIAAFFRVLDATPEQIEEIVGKLIDILDCLNNPNGLQMAASSVDLLIDGFFDRSRTRDLCLMLYKNRYNLRGTGNPEEVLEEALERLLASPDRSADRAERPTESEKDQAREQLTEAIITILESEHTPRALRRDVTDTVLDLANDNQEAQVHNPEWMRQWLPRVLAKEDAKDSE